MQMRSRQRGAGMFKLLFIVGTLAIYGIIGAKLFPLYSDYFMVVKAVKGVASEGSTDPVEVNNALERRWMIEDIKGIQPIDVKIQRGQNGKVSLVYNYESRVHLFYNADIVLTFTGDFPVSGE